MDGDAFEGENPIGKAKGRGKGASAAPASSSSAKLLLLCAAFHSIPAPTMASATPSPLVDVLATFSAAAFPSGPVCIFGNCNVAPGDMVGAYLDGTSDSNIYIGDPSVIGCGERFPVGFQITKRAINSSLYLIVVTGFSSRHSVPTSIGASGSIYFPGLNGWQLVTAIAAQTGDPRGECWIDPNAALCVGTCYADYPRVCTSDVASQRVSFNSSHVRNSCACSDCGGLFIQLLAIRPPSPSISMSASSFPTSSTTLTLTSSGTPSPTRSLTSSTTSTLTSSGTPSPAPPSWPLSMTSVYRNCSDL